MELLAGQLHITKDEQAKEQFEQSNFLRNFCDGPGHGKRRRADRVRPCSDDDRYSCICNCGGRS